MDVPYKLYKGDCLEIMPTLEAGSVDAIITDLPYGTTQCSWDEVIPLVDMWREVKRVLKPKGVFVTTAANPFAGVLIVSNIKWFKYDWTWRKNGGSNFATIKWQPFREHEQVLVFSKETHTYNPQMIYRSNSSLKRDPIGKTRVKKTNVTLGSKIEKYAAINGSQSFVTADGMRNPSSVLEFDLERYPKGFTHPTSKPVDLYRYLIRTYTNEGETVLDITMGSGTTGVAAWMEGRKFIGIERDPKYYSIAEKRISQAAQQPALFHATQQSVQRTGGESGQQNLFSAGDVLPAKVTRQSTRR